jgi:transposase
VRVHIDYHVEFDSHYYSVPHRLARRQLDLRYTAETVEVLDRGERVASHRRSSLKGRHTTIAEHMPESHRRMGEWTPQRLTRWAESIGPATGALIAAVLRERPHPQQAYRACLGILRLAKSYGEARLEAACRRALTLGTHRYRSVESILKRRLDQQSPANTAESTDPIAHDNIRGAGYYH